MSKPIAKAVTSAVNGSKKQQPADAPPVDPPPVPYALDDPRIPKECVLRVSGQDLQAIYAGLDELPGRIGRVVYGRISVQVEAQIRAALQQVPLVPMPPPNPPATGAAKQ